MPDESNEMATCSKCGCRSILKDRFATYYKSKHVHALCPRCYQKNVADMARSSWLAVLTFGLVGYAVCTYVESFLEIIFFGIVVWSLSTVVFSVVHELAHVIACLLVGMRVFVIGIGWYGKLLIDWDILGFNVQLRSLPLGGFVYSAAKQTRLIRTRDFIQTAAGPLSHFVVIAIGIAIVLITMPHSSPYMIAGLIAVVLNNGVAFARSAWPRRFQSPFGNFPNDGLILWLLIRGTGEEVKQLPHAYCYLETNALVRQEHYDEALQVLGERSSIHPDDDSILSLLALVSLYKGEHQSCRDANLSLWFRDNPVPEMVAACKTNIAWSDVFIDGKLEEAERLSNDAYLLTPWEPWVAGTRGVVLFQRGEVDDAIPLLQFAVDESDDPRSRAMHEILLALAQNQAGRSELARRHVQSARKAFANCWLFNTHKRELSEFMIPSS